MARNLGALLNQSGICNFCWWCDNRAHQIFSAELSIFGSTCSSSKGLKCCTPCRTHYGDVIMGAIASQITNLRIAYSTVHSEADQRKHQSSASLAFVRGINRWPVNSPHKWPITRKCLHLMTSSWVQSFADGQVGKIFQKLYLVSAF